MSYADDKNITFVIIIGSEEMETGLLSLKNMKSGEQQKLTDEQIIAYLS
jgi:histidyl-tRNA synthetase